MMMAPMILAAGHKVITLEEFEGPRYNRIAHIKKLLAEQVLTGELRERATA